MVIIEMELSKNQVKQAGRTLKNPDATIAERNHAFDILSEWRSRHVEPLNLAYKLVYRHATSVDKKAFFGQRLKRAVSIISKLKRLPSGLAEMQDIAGCRAIVSSPEYLQKLDLSLSKSKAIDDSKGKDYIKHPKPDGYRGIHKIYRYQGAKEYAKGLMVEIQLRTQLQHSWATAVEIIDIFEQQQLKTGGGENDWKQFFKLASDAFAQHENLEVSSDYSCQRLAQLARKLDVIAKLKSYSVVSKIAQEQHHQGKYLLMWLRKSQKMVQLIPFDDYSSARDMYIAMEKEHANNDNYDVVLVHVDSIKELRKTYPNYFADSKRFVSTLQNILSNADV